MKQKTFIIILIIILLITIFVLQNSTYITIRFWLWNFETPISLILIVFLTIGAIISFLLNISLKRKRKKQLKEKDSKIKKLETTISEMKKKYGIGKPSADSFYVNEKKTKDQNQNGEKSTKGQ